MLNITHEENAEEMNVFLEGRLDTTTAPQLEEFIKTKLDSVKKLCFDLAKLEYISSAGLRVLLLCHKTMAKQGEFIVRNVSEGVKEVFEVTGFEDILNIK
ncbi:MAG: STAS domain-containing protein [Treponemataceae bacterium]|nr:STAS domain-containing protein [Treponemataceae bacterium]